MKKIALLILSIVLLNSSCSNSDDNGSGPVSFKEKNLIGKWQIKQKIVYDNFGALVSNEILDYDNCSNKTYTEFLSSKTIKYLTSEINELNECIVEEDTDYTWLIKDNILITQNTSTNNIENHPIIILNDEELSITLKEVMEDNRHFLIQLFYTKKKDTTS